MARRNKGVFEPEFRLTLMLPATIFATIGFLGFGMSVQAGYPIVYSLVFMSIHSLSVPFASTASLTYVIDCHPKDANQAFVTINFTKAVFTFLATSYANGIMAKIGPGAVFNAITCINLGICALTIPAYVFGKRFRSYVSLQRVVFLVMMRMFVLIVRIDCKKFLWEEGVGLDVFETCVAVVMLMTGCVGLNGWECMPHGGLRSFSIDVCGM
jgi:hypothetical protein